MVPQAQDARPAPEPWLGHGWHEHLPPYGLLAVTWLKDARVRGSLPRRLPASPAKRPLPSVPQPRSPCETRVLAMRPHATLWPAREIGF